MQKNSLIKYTTFALLIFLLGCEIKVSKKNKQDVITEKSDSIENNNDKGTKESEPDEDKTKTEIDSTKTPLPEAIPRSAKYLIKGLEYGRYQAEITWTRGLTNISVYLNGTSVYSQQDINTSSYVMDLQSDTNYSIRVYTVNDDRNLEVTTKEKSLIAAWEIRTPLDLLLNQNILDTLFSKNEGNTISAHRIFLEKDSELFTNGNNLSLKAEELFTDRSAISTFSPGSKAPNDTNGRSGGMIFINAKRAHGLLTLNMRGEHGGDGIDGLSFIDRAGKGARGENGLCAIVEGPRRIVYNCDRKNGQGQRGAKGADANPGSNGGAGGNTGLCKVQIAEESPDFLVDIKKTAGQPGNPGHASQPQLGGLGGDPGHSTGDGNCCPLPNPKNEGDGANGNPAPDGIKQSDGLMETECVSIGPNADQCF
jgi:hypothetical protein